MPKETLSSEIMYRAYTHPIKRSFKALTSNDKPVYRQPIKLNLENYLYVETEADLIHQLNSKKEDLVWILVRYKSSEFLLDSHTVPDSMRLFNLVLKTNVANPTSKAFYLASID